MKHPLKLPKMQAQATTIKRAVSPFYRYARRRLLGEGVINYRGKGTVNLIDVGSVGDLPYPWKENARKVHHLLKFEPRDQPSKSLNIATMNCALWETNADRDFYIYTGFRGTGSSLLQQDYEYVAENLEQLRGLGPTDLADTWLERSQLDRIETVACRRLDDVLHDLGHPFPYHFMKVDAQGAEYEILKGGEGFLSESCVGLHLELFVIPLYKGIKLLPKVAEYLNGFGFTLVKKFPAHGTFDSQHDCIFLKRDAVGPVADTIRQIYDL